ncbi:peptide chain release factor 1 [Methylophilus medardicus]|uniref:Peptide chain release factor 1 n=1 Tax=Methylophilus medardicus TaxID=2588534 RepID=A0A5B8CV53_9PROT|nr:peptide chain release factor 1 [Methylophilus medardicus]QDC45178.1 peptide chain release factor 1 [Methylophilus medardicus]QDC50185.1 peptide chain release factor 1 [Methylophilus medardicus]QDC53890.1 peptide chain release factor 1 [Methylophilus medardicus]
MKPSMLQKLANLSERLEELNRLLSSEGVTDNMDNYRKIMQEHTEITPIVEQYHIYTQTESDLKEAHLMLADPEMKAFAQEEIDSGKKRLEEVALALQTLLLPKDPSDDKNIFLEIRAGTGGDESGLFAGDLFRMYSRFADRQGWKVEVVSANEGEVGGYKEIIAKIIGYGAYSKLKFESGGHRVQRVPDTETQGRIHTSACTVAILPEVEEVGDVEINPADIRIDTFRASGAGGQHINKTDSAVRITHAPTGIVVECQDGRSQHANKAQAMQVLAARIKAKQVDEQQSKIASERRNLIGSGDRSERIRTYNYPQGRITDHRINLTLYKIEAITEGDMDELIHALATEYQADLLASLGEEG